MTDIEIAVEAARAGAAILLHYWERLGPDDADLKARHDWVSRADRESERAIIDTILARRPSDGFLGEETGLTPSSNDRVWIIDPLDGTSNYLQHFPFWCISIALRQHGEVVAGVIYEPLRDQLFTAAKGVGAFRNGVPMRVREREGMDGSFLATGFPFRAQTHVATYTAIFADVIRRAKGVRRAGSAALDLAYTAAGVFDGFFELQLAPWDISAGTVLIREAGGLVTDFSGGDRFWERGNIVGAPAGVHAELLALIATHTSEDRL